MIIGIDLGTTNSLVRYFDGDTWKLIPNEFGNVKTPSVVSFNNDETYVVGDIAFERLDTHATATFSNFKREIGNDFTYSYDSLKLNSVELSSLLIRYLVDQAQAYLETEVHEAVITVPAYFDDMQRQATKMAGSLAGIVVNRIINEPSSAALAYHLNYHHEGYSLVFDFGGGTLDITVVDIFANVVDVLAIVGDTYLGGIDIDEAIANHFINSHPKLRRDFKKDKSEIVRLARFTKEKLTNQKSSELVFNYNESRYATVYSNQLLMEICADMLLKIRNLVDIALLDANISINDLSHVIGVGGSSNVLFVRQYLERILGKKVSLELNPDEAIALGAGIAASIKLRHPKVKDIILTDVCPFAIGLDLVDDRFGVIIPKNTTLPVVMTQRFTTVRDWQEVIEFTVLQGDSPIASLNKRIGELNYINVEIEEVGIPSIYVTLAYDINGILEVRVKSKVDSNEITLITNPHLDEAVISLQKEKLANLSESINVNAKAQLLISKTEALYRRANYVNKESIIASLKVFVEIIKDSKQTKVLRAIESFEEYVDTLSNELNEDGILSFKADSSSYN